MPALIERARAARQSAHAKRLLKFAAVSVVSTVITQTVLFVTYDVISLASAMVCNVIATAVSTVPAYWLNRTWTWGKRGKSHPWREVAPFWIIAFIGLVLSTVAVGLAAHNADRISSSKLIERGFVQFANLFTYGLIWVGRYLVFNRFLFGETTKEGLPPGPPEAIALEEKRVHEHPSEPGLASRHR
jgi:putative flippase GtrA